MSIMIINKKDLACMIVGEIEREREKGTSHEPTREN